MVIEGKSGIILQNSTEGGVPLFEGSSPTTYNPKMVDNIQYLIYNDIKYGGDRDEGC